jgi:hypothetical protein
MLEILKLLVALGFGSVLVHLLTTGGDQEYERCFKEYSTLQEKSRSLLTSEPRDRTRLREALMIAINQAWLYASDDVVNSLNEITDAAKGSPTEEESRRLFGELMVAMRRDLQRKQKVWFRLRLWGRTKLIAANYRLIGGGRNQAG